MPVIMPDIRTAEARVVFFEALYLKAYPTAARYIHSKGGSIEDAKDIFQDALIIYYEKQVSGGLDIHHSDAAYITGIVRHLWSKHIRTQSEEVQVDSIDGVEEAEAEAQGHPSTGKLLAFLEVAGKKCLDMLKAFYYDKMPVEQVAGTFGYSGTRSATVQKYKCLEKLRDTVKEKSLTYADFVE